MEEKTLARVLGRSLTWEEKEFLRTEIAYAANIPSDWEASSYAHRD